MAKKINEKELKKVTGGTSTNGGWYYIIEYKDSPDLSSCYGTHGGPYTSESDAQIAGEDAKNTLVSKGYTVLSLKTKYDTSSLKDGFFF